MDIKGKYYIETLFPYAYNILGSAEDAKDVVQDVLVSYLERAHKDLEDEKNYLIRSVVNAAISLKDRHRRMRSRVRMWLPEPVATGDSADGNLILKDVLSYSLLILMERLTAKERAVFLLKETFDYPHVEIARLLGTTEQNCRKLLSRAKTSLFKPPQKRTAAQLAHEREVAMRFVYAIRQRDTKQLESVLSDDIRFYADGGDKMPLLATACTGRVAVADLVIKIFTLFLHSVSMKLSEINHQPALVVYDGDRLNSCHVFDLHPETGCIMRIDVVIDPDKLISLNSQYESHRLSR